MMTPFLLKVTVTELGYLVLLPALSLIWLIASTDNVPFLPNPTFLPPRNVESHSSFSRNILPGP